MVVVTLNICLIWRRNEQCVPSDRGKLVKDKKNQSGPRESFSRVHTHTHARAHTCTRMRFGSRGAWILVLSLHLCQRVGSLSHSCTLRAYGGLIRKTVRQVRSDRASSAFSTLDQEFSFSASSVLFSPPAKCQVIFRSVILDALLSA
jgi:hypothetical protein